MKDNLKRLRKDVLNLKNSLNPENFSFALYYRDNKPSFKDRYCLFDLPTEKRDINICGTTCCIVGALFLQENKVLEKTKTYSSILSISSEHTLIRGFCIDKYNLGDLIQSLLFYPEVQLFYKRKGSEINSENLFKNCIAPDEDVDLETACDYVVSMIDSEFIQELNDVILEKQNFQEMSSNSIAVGETENYWYCISEDGFNTHFNLHVMKSYYSCFKQEVRDYFSHLEEENAIIDVLHNKMDLYRDYISTKIIQSRENSFELGLNTGFINERLHIL